MKKVDVPLTFSKKIMASSLYEAKQIMTDELSYKPYSDSYKEVEINNIEISSYTNVSDLSASSPSNMQMKQLLM